MRPSTPTLVERLNAALRDHYVVDREIGRGGMAVVFLARDLKHGREVAIKVLHPEIAASVGTERFLREVHTTARLQHPHILPLHDSGEADGLLYYVMPYHPNDSLATVLERGGALPSHQAVAIAAEIADALAHAHSLGIVHRDVKPGNVLMAGGGHVCVADFGLARLVDPAVSRRLTSTGMMVGSPLYMSPEQAMGEGEITGRADVYGLGCVLFEMLTGKPPYPGETAQAVLGRHLTERPPSLRSFRAQLSTSLERLITQALQKDPRKRPSAAAFRDALAALEGGRNPWLARGRRWWVVGAAGGLAAVGLGAFLLRERLREEPAALAAEAPLVPADHSIAVLPFENLGGDSADVYFSDGITEDILTNIGKLGTVNVISRSSVMQYRGTSKTARQIGEELGVTRVLVGTVRRDGTRVRITASLVNAENNRIIWTDDYGKDGEDVFTIQSEIAAEILTALRTELTPEQRLRVGSSPTDNLSAYDLFLKGREHLNAFRDPRDARTAIGLFHQALALDPEYAPAHAGLGRAYQILFQYTGTVGLDSAIYHGGRAVQLDRELADGYSALGRTYSSAKRYSAALAQLRQALALNPNDADAVTEVAEVYTQLGRYADALPWARRAVALQPTTGRGYANVGELYFDLGELETAERWLGEALRLEPDELWANALMVHLHSVRGDTAAAARYLDTILAAAPDGAWGYVQAGLFAVQQGDYPTAIRHYLRAGSGETAPLELGFAYAMTGATREASEIFARNEREARAQLREGEAGPFPYVQLARIHAARGEAQQAVTAMRTAYQHGARDIYFYRMDPMLRRLEGDPGYAAILADIRADLASMRQRVDASEQVARHPVAP